MKRKLGINTAAGVIDIIGAILYIIASVIVGATLLSSGGDLSAAMGASIIFRLFAVLGLILHIVGLVKSKQNSISISGHVLGIIAHGIYAILLDFIFIPTILCILAAIFTLMQKNLPMENAPEA